MTFTASPPRAVSMYLHRGRLLITDEAAVEEDAACTVEEFAVPGGQVEMIRRPVRMDHLEAVLR
ncbi:hypothetical protein SALCHL_004719 [Streptomyces albus subsp. chlorinus]|uniref:hypothetical protein n=1 Tax=Streptomyces albus TaxID=1888 RepID=UPI00156E6754|nr:hypothetical protein [Streptomyces albus]